MNYYLSISGLPNPQQIEINSSEYLELKKARKVLSNALSIEEKYDILISNYLSLEKRLLDLAVDFMVLTNLEYTDLYQERHSLNICLVNLLTSARLYVDQLPQNVQECVPNHSRPSDIVKEFFSREHDGNKEYRFMDALRNYVQHRGIPVHLIKHDCNNNQTSAGNFLEYRIEIFSVLSNLKADDSFKKPVLVESDEYIDLKTGAKSYIESLSTVHDSVRSLISESVSMARETIENMHNRYKGVYPYDQDALCAFAQNDDGSINSIPLFLKWDDVRKELQKRNRPLVNLKKRYISSIFIPSNKKQEEESEDK